MKAIVYGAGSMGAEVAALVVAQGYELQGVLDDKAAASGRCIAGMPVADTATWLRTNDPSQVEAFVAIHNPFASVAALERRLHELGFARTVNPVQLYQRFPGALPDKYWLTSTSPPSAWLELAAQARALLADDLSRRIFDATLRLRATGDYSQLPAPTPAEQYLPRDLPPLPSRLAVVDCGAFVGDTLHAIVAAGHELTRVLVFEPDPANYRELIKQWSHLPGAVFAPCGVGDRTELAAFAVGGGAASGLRADSTVFCQCVALDDFAPMFPAQLVKLDVEGAEPAALRGAQGLVSRFRPRLAVSVYHHPAHLWEVVRMLAAWKLDYLFLLRGHAFNAFDTVLYAIPQESQRPL